MDVHVPFSMFPLLFFTQSASARANQLFDSLLLRQVKPAGRVGAETLQDVTLMRFLSLDTHSDTP